MQTRNIQYDFSYDHFGKTNFV